MLVVAVISVDAYPFLAFSDLTCHLEDTGIGVFWLHCAAWFTHGSASLQLFPVVWIFLRTLGVICYDRWVLSEGHKNYFKDWCLMNLQPTFLFLTYVNLRIVSTICYHFFIFSPSDSPLKTTRNFFISSEKHFLFSRYSIFCYFFPSSSRFSNSKGQMEVE